MKTHKYKATKTVIDGITFDSKKEADYSKKLALLLKAGKIKDLSRQVAFCWIEKHSHDGKEIDFKRRYVADFVYYDVTLKKTIIVDVKGFKTTEYKKKKKIVEKIFEIKITEV